MAGKKLVLGVNDAAVVWDADAEAWSVFIPNKSGKEKVPAEVAIIAEFAMNVTDPEMREQFLAAYAARVSKRN